MTACAELTISTQRAHQPARDLGGEAKSWKNIWSAAQDAGSIISAICTGGIQDLVARLDNEYHAVIQELEVRGS